MGILNSITKFFKGYGSSSFLQLFDSPARWGRAEYIRQYRKNGYVHAAISAIAEPVGMIKCELYKYRGNTGELVKEDVSPYLDFIYKPNPQMSKFQLMEITQSFLEATGEAFWYLAGGEVTGRPKEAYPLRPDTVAIATDEDGFVTGYTINPPGEAPIPVEVTDIVHFRMPNLEDIYRGLGPTEAGQDHIQTETLTTEFNRNYLYNNAAPSGVLSISGNMDDKTFQDLKNRFRNEYGNVKNAGKLMVIKKAQVEFESFQSDVSRFINKEMRNLGRDDILAMYRVPKILLGITEDVNYASAKSAYNTFLDQVIDPKMMRIIDAIQKQVIDVHYPGLVLRHVSPVPEDQEKKLALVTAGLNNFMTVNEAREAFGLNPMEGGDVLYYPMNLAPTELVDTEVSAQSKSIKGKKKIRITLADQKKN